MPDPSPRTPSSRNPSRPNGTASPAASGHPSGARGAGELPAGTTGPGGETGAAGTRLDAELVRRGLARSRGQARELVLQGAVTVDGVPARKPSSVVTDEQSVALATPVEPWVSRGAHKLVAALDAFGPHGLRVEGRRCIDVGASTGGFTQVLLTRGAAHVVALDVGHGQLVEEVRTDARVTERSGTTVRGLDPADVGGPADLVVADLSFISLRAVIDTLAALTRPDGDLVLLVKPQFEVGRTRLGKGGLVRDPADRACAITDVVEAATGVGLHPRALLESPIRGTTGNAEYLLWLTPGDQGALRPEDVATMATTLAGRDPS